MLAVFLSLSPAWSAAFGPPAGTLPAVDGFLNLEVVPECARPARAPPVFRPDEFCSPQAVHHSRASTQGPRNIVAVNATPEADVCGLPAPGFALAGDDYVAHNVPGRAFCLQDC